MVLWHTWTCPYCARVRIALAEKGIPYDEREVDLRHKPPELARLNPASAVPVLVVGDAPIPESLVIVQYLEDRFPERPLLPKDPLGRARARLLSDRITALLGPHSYKLARGTDPEKRAAAAGAKAALVTLEREAPPEGLLAGPDLSLPDIALAPFVARLPPELRPSALLLPKLAQWEAAVMARASVATHTAPTRPA
jgi:glutathione S-transferase